MDLAVQHPSSHRPSSSPVRSGRALGSGRRSPNSVIGTVRISRTVSGPQRRHDVRRAAPTAHRGRLPTLGAGARQRLRGRNAPVANEFELSDVIPATPQADLRRLDVERRPQRHDRFAGHRRPRGRRRLRSVGRLHHRSHPLPRDRDIGSSSRGGHPSSPKTKGIRRSRSVLEPDDRGTERSPSGTPMFPTATSATSGTDGRSTTSSRCGGTSRPVEHPARHRRRGGLRRRLRQPSTDRPRQRRRNT